MIGTIADIIGGGRGTSFFRVDDVDWWRDKNGEVTYWYYNPHIPSGQVTNHTCAIVFRNDSDSLPYTVESLGHNRRVISIRVSICEWYIQYLSHLSVCSNKMFLYYYQNHYNHFQCRYRMKRSWNYWNRHFYRRRLWRIPSMNSSFDPDHPSLSSLTIMEQPLWFVVCGQLKNSNNSFHSKKKKVEPCDLRAYFYHRRTGSKRT
jgi:hypothetical protein